MVAPEGFKSLDAVGKAAVVKLFANLQSAHNSLANVASSIMDLGRSQAQTNSVTSYHWPFTL